MTTLETLPHDLFMKIIIDNLKCKDIINLYNTSKSTKNKCKSKFGLLFRKLLDKYNLFSALYEPNKQEKQDKQLIIANVHQKMQNLLLKLGYKPPFKIEDFYKEPSPYNTENPTRMFMKFARNPLLYVISKYDLYKNETIMLDLSSNPAVKFTDIYTRFSKVPPELLIDTIDWNWDWYEFSRNPSVTWDIIHTYANDWYIGGLSRNPSVTLDVIESNVNEGWDYSEMSRNPNITDEFVEKHMNVGIGLILVIIKICQ